jgi:hypothetical protein
VLDGHFWKLWCMRLKVMWMLSQVVVRDVPIIDASSALANKIAGYSLSLLTTIAVC